jgi:CRISPR type III-A-associated RAMP protein Csm4
MHPGLVVKLRPSGPWRIGPDSGARNRVDVVYHSDSLYSAVTWAMARLGSIEEWLDATGRTPEPAVCFSSCFPFQDGIAYVVPPRTVWPPASQAMSARVRWKSARFVPMKVVQAILAGRKLDETQWTIDGPSECLAPAGSPGPFRTAVRWNAAVDRLTGVTERHATACLEFRPGCGLWTVASFAGEAARDRWQEPIKAAFRLLADTGFGGERSRGWGRSETPEFVEGTLPEMILPAIRETAKPAPAEVAEASVQAPAEIAPLVVDLTDGGAGGSACQTDPVVPDSVSTPEQPAAPELEFPAPDSGIQEETAGQADPPAPPEPAVAPSLPALAPEQPALDPGIQEETAGQADPPAPPEPAVASALPTPAPEQPAPDPGIQEETAGQADPPAPPEPAVAPSLPAPAPEQPAPDPGNQEETAGQAEPPAPPEPAAAPEQLVPAPGFENAVPHWLLSLFTPAPADAVDWKRGDYVVLSRGGRVESPAGSGELKKQIHMVAEGSVLFAVSAPRGLATDVAPDGFAHPVYRAGFAVAVPLPKGS